MTVPRVIRPAVLPYLSMLAHLCCATMLPVTACQPPGSEPPVEFPRAMTPPTPDDPTPTTTTAPAKPAATAKASAPNGLEKAANVTKVPLPAKAKRRIAYRLLDRPEAATPVPPLTGRARLECIRAPDDTVLNPYSKLPEPARRHHARVTLGGGGVGRVELRDALVFGGPRTFVFRGLTAPPSARLELGYRVVACGSSASVRLEVEVLHGDAGKTDRYSRELEPPSEPQGSRFADWWRKLDLPTGTKFDLTLRFTGDVDPVSRIILTEPVITGGPAEVPTLRDRNVLLVIVDAMRGDAVGPSRRLPNPVAPVIERWIQGPGGVAFKQAMSVSNQTRASTVALLQGQAPTHGHFHATSWQLNAARKATYHGSNPPLVTRRLAEAGHRVATIGHNRFLWNAAPIGLDHGYDEIVDVRALTDDTRLITDHAITYVEKHRDARWFLTVNYVAPHNPYKPPEGYVERVGKLSDKDQRRPMTRKYLGEIAYVDDQIARLSKRMTDLGLDAQTLVIVTADHGETFHGKHTCYSERFKMNCHFNHGLTLYDEEVHVPLGFVLPGVFKAGAPSEVVSHLSVTPTILELMGLTKDPRHTAPSLLDVLLGKPAQGLGKAYLETRAASGLRTERHKFIVHHPRNDVVTPARTGGRRGRGPLEEAYDVQIDPEEVTNLVLADRADLIRGLRGSLAGLRRQLATPNKPPRTADSPKTAEANAKTTTNQSIWHRDAIRIVGGVKGVSFYVRLSPARCPIALNTRCKTLAGKEMAVEWVGDVPPAGVVDLNFDTPDAQQLTLSARFNATAVEASHLKFGPYGIAASGVAPPVSPKMDRGVGTGTGSTTLRLQPQDLLAANGAHPPHVAGLTTPTLFYWRPEASAVARYQRGGAPEAAGSGNDSDDAAMSKDMRRILKELGYSK